MQWAYSRKLEKKVLQQHGPSEQIASNIDHIKNRNLMSKIGNIRSKKHEY